MSGHTVFLFTDDDARYRALLADAELPGLTVAAADSLTQALQLAAGADLWLAEPSRAAALLPRARRLAWLQATYAGVEPLVAAGARRDYCLTNVRGPFGPLASEYVFAHLLSLTRHLPLYREQQRRRVWNHVPYRGLGGRTLLVVGTGSIGCHVAATGGHFGMRVWGVSRSGRSVAGFDRVEPVQALAAMLPEADVIVSALPSTPETRHLFDEVTLGRCHPGALFFNVGRGTAVDERALAEALRQGRLGAAVLDVFAEEPLSEASPLWDVPNLVVTPHDAARSFPEDVVEVFVRNYRHFVSGEPLEGRIDFERGY
ncbi:MAG: D-2-hydroxyacid dehydrogenase [Deltaproteobacteria bacterium]|nr:D-2-hydroxyacid dehydrogenase [Deltaproteobacteria bacterium]